MINRLSPLAWLSPTASVVLLLLLQACGGGGADEPPSGVVIGAAGGSVASADGRATLVVPPGALAADTRMTVTSASSAPSGALAGTTYDLGPDGTVFAVPARLTLGYDPAALPAGVAESELRLAKATGGAWVEIPGSAVDSTLHRVSAPLNGLSTYGLVAPAPPVGTTVYVVDDPPAGSPLHFREILPAVDYLCGVLQEEEQGLIIVQTERPLAVDSLVFACDIKIMVEPGKRGHLQGPADKPLRVDAAGAMNLAGFDIASAQGMVVNANRRLELSGNALPADTTINIGGVAGADFPAGRGVGGAGRQATTQHAGVDVVDNTCAGLLRTRWSADVTSDARYRYVGNEAASIDFAGSAKFGGTSQLELEHNKAALIQIREIKFVADAQLVCKDHVGVELFDCDAVVDGQNRFTLTGNVFGGVNVRVKGIGSATVGFRANQVNGGTEFHFDTADEDLELTDSTLGTCLLVAGAVAVAGVWRHVAVTGKDCKILEWLKFDLPVGNYAHVKLENVKDEGPFDLTLGGKLKLDLSKNCVINGYVDVTFHGNVADITDFDTDYKAGVGFTIKIPGWRSAPSSRQADESQSFRLASRGASYHNGLRVNVEDADIPLDITVEDATLTGDPDYLTGIAISKPTPEGEGRHRPGRRRAARQDDFTPQVVLRNVQASKQTGGAMLGLDGLDEPITIESCALTGTNLAPAIDVGYAGGTVTLRGNQCRTAAVGVHDSEGPVLIEDNEITSGGLPPGVLIEDVRQLVTLRNNTIGAAGQALMPSLSVAGSRALVEGNTLGGAEVAGLMVTGGEAGAGIVHALRNLFLGQAQVMPGGLLRTAENTFAGELAIVDGNPSGGLVNDPVAANPGINPEKILTSVDFNGNGCADYPPPEKDEHGQCIRQGVPPPADPGL